MYIIPKFDTDIPLHLGPPPPKKNIKKNKNPSNNIEKKEEDEEIRGLVEIKL